MDNNTVYGLAWKRSLVSRSFAITVDGSRIAAGADGQVFMLSDSGSTLWARELPDYASPLDVHMTPDGSRVATTLEYDSGLYMWTGEGRLLWEFTETGEVWDLAMNQDGG